MISLLAILLCQSAFGTMSAKEARHAATKERVRKERACVDNFRESVDKAIDEAVSHDECSINSDCYTCNHGIYASQKRLEKLGYKVEIRESSSHCEPGVKYLYISWSE